MTAQPLWKPAAAHVIVTFADEILYEAVRKMVRQ